MQAAALILMYLLIVVIFQAFGFGISRIVAQYWPGASLLTFLLLFLAAYGFAWPVAVRITEALIVRAGYKVQEPDPNAR